MANPDKDSFLDNYYQDVQSEFESDINDIKSFFIDKGYSDVQSNELIYTLSRAIYHIKRDKEERLKLEKKVLPLLKDRMRLDIKNLEAVLGLRTTLKNQLGNDALFFKSLKDKIVKEMKLKSFPRSGGNILLRLALTPFFWKLKEFGKGQSAQINLAYDIFNHYEMDDYGTVGENIGEIEQKDRIRTQFQQPAMKYWDNFDQHLGSMVS